MSVPAFIEARRSIRAFTDRVVPGDLIESWVTAACAAPAPHHSRPWRFVSISSEAHKDALASGMSAAWKVDLAADGAVPSRVEELVAASHLKIMRAPAIVLGCLTWDGLDRYLDQRRNAAEFGMALLSLGAAVENLMLSVAHDGFASCWVASPIFCPEAARDALALPQTWLPHAMVVIGEADPSYVGRPRPPVLLDDLYLPL